MNKYNEHELGKAQEMADDLGIFFFPAEMGLAAELTDCDFKIPLEERKKAWLPSNKKYIAGNYKGAWKEPVYNTPCLQLFNTLVVNPDGKIFPCCVTSDKNSTFGDLYKESIEEIWNNDKYTYSRSPFTGSSCPDPAVHTICTACGNYKKFRT